MGNRNRGPFSELFQVRRHRIVLVGLACLALAPYPIVLADASPLSIILTSSSFPALKKNILQVDFTCKQLTWQIQRMGSKSRSRAPPWAPTGRTPAAQHQRRNLGEISFELCLFRAHALRSTPQQQALCEGRPEQPRMT